MVRKVSTKTSVPTSEKDSDMNCTEKVESKETETLSINSEIQTKKEVETVKITKNVQIATAAFVLFVSIWHPYVALFATLAVLLHKVSEDWPKEEELVFLGDIKKLISENQANRTVHDSRDPDFLRGVEFARQHRSSIAKAIMNGQGSVTVYLGWQEHFSDFRSGVAAELGLKPAAITEVFPLCLKIVL